MDAYLLSIGDELLIGQTTNTNAAWLGERLSLMGLEVVEGRTLTDRNDRIRAALHDACAAADLVVITGGLGPTHDDLTKIAVADFLGVEMHRDDALWERIQTYYTERNRPVPERAAQIADMPAGFEKLANPIGTAPGLRFQGEASNGALLIVLPGVPAEMKAIFDASVQPLLSDRTDLRSTAHRTLQTTGIGESDLQAEIGDAEALLPERVSLAYLPSTSGVRLRLTARADDPDAATQLLDAAEARIRKRANAHIFATGNVSLAEALGRRLTDAQLTVATAESATGGLVGDRLTDVPGSSSYYTGGIIAYANAVKINQLQVDAEVLSSHGAVSEPVARQMADGVRALLGTDIGLATTGIAGPGGGSDAKPVGTVWVGYADAHGTHAAHVRFVNDRHMNKALFATAALDMVRRQLNRRDGQDAASPRYDSVA
jgi:nicotinamide-nucleotide amidase